MIVVFHREFEKEFVFMLAFYIFIRNAVVPLQLQDQRLEAISPNNTKLFNSMIYPFMRTVIYGVIWYQGNRKRK